jgi:hypothetical protein
MNVKINNNKISYYTTNIIIFQPSTQEDPTDYCTRQHIQKIKNKTKMDILFQEN